MSFELVKLPKDDVNQFKEDMQEAFNKGAERYSGKKENVLPSKDIDNALNADGAAAYKAVMDGQMVGGTIVNIDKKTQHNYLAFLYVKSGNQGKKVGQQIWNTLQAMYPETKVWEAMTPYFDQRNIHFYVNKLGFQVVEFFNHYHVDPNGPGDYYAGSNPFGMFRFEKIMKK